VREGPSILSLHGRSLALPHPPSLTLPPPLPPSLRGAVEGQNRHSAAGGTRPFSELSDQPAWCAMAAGGLVLRSAHARRPRRTDPRLVLRANSSGRIWARLRASVVKQANSPTFAGPRYKAESAVCSVVQCSVVQCSTAQCSAMQCNAVQCSAVHRRSVLCSARQCSAVQCSAVQCSVV
jgi:hypothetical protein